MDNVLKASALSLGFSKVSPLLNDLTFEVSQEMVLGLTGESGIGKSTLLKLIAGLRSSDFAPATAGMLSSGGIDLLRSSSQELEQHRNTIGLVTEDPKSGLHPQRSIGALWARNAPITLLIQYLERLGFEDPLSVVNRYAYQLSGGEAQRVRLAFALSGQPRLLLLESPTAALDAKNARLVWDCVAEQRQQLGFGTVVVSHDLELINRVSDQHIHLADGRLSEPPATLKLSRKLKQSPSSRLVEIVIKAFSFEGSTRPFIQNLRLVIHKSEIVVTLGESGSGKTTFGRVVAGMLEAFGELRWTGGNSSVTNFAKEEFDKADHRIQYIFQEPRRSVNPSFSVSKTLRQALKKDRATGYSVGSLMQAVGLPVKLKSQSVLALSTGELQRLVIARALAVGPELLICDEITAGLDQDTAIQILSLLQRLVAEQELSVIFITHDLRIAKSIGDRITVFENGAIVEEGVTAEVVGGPKHLATQKLLGFVGS